MHTNVPSPVHNESAGKVHCNNVDTEKGTWKDWNEMYLAEEKNPKATIPSWTKFAFKSVVTANIILVCSMLITVYFLLARLDIHFVLTKGSVQFPGGGNIVANLTLAGQALPGWYYIIISVPEEERTRERERFSIIQFPASGNIFFVLYNRRGPCRS